MGLNPIPRMKLTATPLGPVKSLMAKCNRVHPTVLVDGQVVATCYYTTTADQATLHLEPLANLNDRARARIRAGATDLLTELAPEAPSEVTGV